HAAVPADHDDDGRGAVRRAAARVRHRRRLRAAQAARHRDRRRARDEPAAHAVHDARDLPLSRSAAPAEEASMIRPGVLAIALAAACTVGPKYHVPRAPVPEAPGYKEANRAGPWRVASPADAMLRGDWWKIFREPELDALEAQIDLHNQTLAQAYANYMAARAQIRIARAQYFPTASIAPSVTTGRGVATGSN